MSPAEAVTECAALVIHVAARLARRTGLEIDDLKQEGFAEVLRCLPKWDPERAPFRSFAVMRVDSRLREHARIERRRGLTARGAARGRGRLPLDVIGYVPEVPDVGREAEQETALASAQERATLEERIAALPARDREIIRAHLAEDRTEEIAARLGVSHSRVVQLLAEIETWLRTGQAPVRNRIERYRHEDGRSDSIAGWARYSGVRYSTLRQRLENGWTVREAIETPVDIRRGRAEHRNAA